MSAAEDPVVRDLVDARRLADPSRGGTRATFTVAKTAALLALRDDDLGGPWHWTLELVRAANAVSDAPMVQARQHTRQRDEELGRIVELDFTVPGAEFRDLELRDLLSGALSVDRGAPLKQQLSPTQRLERWRQRVATALNGAMAGEARRITLETPVGGRRYSWRADAGEGRDPFSPEIAAGLDQGGADPAAARFLVRLEMPAPGLGRRFGDWLSGRWDVAAVVGELWGARLVGADRNARADRGMSLAPMGLEHGVALGEHARLHGLFQGDGLWLVRDGVKLLRLDRLAKAGLSGVPAGLVECPSLRLTADRADIARDAAWELLVAWLHDTLAHLEPEADQPHRARVRRPDGPLPKAALVSGFELTPQALEKRVRSGRDLLYVWKHQRELVPEAAGAKVLALWPSELARLRAQLPGARLVPLRALGDRPEFDPVDLTSLAQGSYDPLTLCKAAPWRAPEGPALRLDVQAYVHRHSGARSGRTILLAYERQVAVLQGPEHVLPGLSLVVRIDADDGDLDVDALRGDKGITAAIGAHVRQLAADNHEQLLRHLLGGESRFDPWSNPMFRAALDSMNAVTLGLRYVATDGELRLTWHDSVALELRVAQTRDGAARTVRDALERARDVGLVVIASGRGRWSTLSSADPRLEPWQLDHDGGGLLQRLLGSQVLMGMPAVPERHPMVAAASAQRHLLVQRRQVERDLSRSTQDEDARLRLVGHLLVARALGEDELGLGSVPLFARYDPRALQAVRWVSLDAIAAEAAAPGVVYPGATSRSLPGVVIELAPGPAALIHEALGLSGEPQTSAGASLVSGRAAGSSGSGSSGASTSSATRRRQHTEPPLMSLPVVHPDAIGSLHIAADGSSRGVTLWLEGLQVGQVQLPEPLGRVSGRLWLRRPRDPAALRPEVQGLARDMLAVLIRQRLLTAPDSDRRAKLDAFLEYARNVVAKHDPMQLAEILGVGPGPAPVVESALDRSLRNWPLRKLPARPDSWLPEVVTQSLGLDLQIKTATLSWSPVRLLAPSSATRGRLVLELGLRNAWIHRALYPESEAGALVDRRAAANDAFIAASVVVGEYFRLAEEAGNIPPDDTHRTVAQWRLLALLFENLDS